MLARRGKKTKQWDRIRAQLNQELILLGIDWCEAGLDGCMGKLALGHAHSQKRRNITNEEELRETALVCTSCHQKLELLPEMEMRNKVLEIRSKRGMN